MLGPDVLDADGGISLSEESDAEEERRIASAALLPAVMLRIEGNWSTPSRQGKILEMFLVRVGLLRDEISATRVEECDLSRQWDIRTWSVLVLYLPDEVSWCKLMGGRTPSTNVSAADPSLQLSFKHVVLDELKGREDFAVSWDVKERVGKLMNAPKDLGDFSGQGVAITLLLADPSEHGAGGRADVTYGLHASCIGHALLHGPTASVEDAGGSGAPRGLHSQLKGQNYD